MNTFSKKLVTFLSTLMGAGLIYVAVLMFVGQTSTNTYYKDSNNAVQKVMADLNFYQSNNGGESEPYNNTRNNLHNDYSSKMFPIKEVYQEIAITQDVTPITEVTPIIVQTPAPIVHSH